jgi:hypothetical protein
MILEPHEHDKLRFLAYKDSDDHNCWAVYCRVRRINKNNSAR